MSRLEQYEYYLKEGFNPTANIFSNQEEYLKFERIRKHLYVNLLHLPPMLWRNAKVLEIGPSSGESSLPLAKLGARFTFVDALASATEALQQLYKNMGVYGQIDQIINCPVESFEPLKEHFDVVIAEGFLSTLSKKKEVINKIFSALRPDGLLIFSTQDRLGMLIEYFKVALIREYCRNQNLTSLEDKIKVADQFFGEDFRKLPSSRPFSDWAKDILFSPLTGDWTFYDFDEILNDLGAQTPKYYSSYPSYLPVNSLRWFKNVPSDHERNQEVLSSYKNFQPTFVLGKVKSNLDSCEELLAASNPQLLKFLKNISHILGQALEGKSTFAQVMSDIAQSKVAVSGEMGDFIGEILSNLSNPSPEIYLKSKYLRTFWGVPNHYIVLRK